MRGLVMKSKADTVTVPNFRLKRAIADRLRKFAEDRGMALGSVIALVVVEGLAILDRIENANRQTGTA